MENKSNMDERSKEWISDFFSVLTKDELISFLEELYRTGYGDALRGEDEDFEDSIKFILEDHKEIEQRIKK